MWNFQPIFRRFLLNNTMWTCCFDWNTSSCRFHRKNSKIGMAAWSWTRAFPQLFVQLFGQLLLSWREEYENCSLCCLRCSLCRHRIQSTPPLAHGVEVSEASEIPRERSGASLASFRTPSPPPPHCMVIFCVRQWLCLISPDNRNKQQAEREGGGGGGGDGRG